MTPLLETRALTRAFGKNHVLRGVSLSLLPGEVLALAGENGAGKSTLVRILSGVDAGHGGTMRLGGAAFRPQSPREATERGVVTIHQELSLVGALSVEENLFLGRDQGSLLGPIRRRSGEARAILGSLGLGVDPARRVEDLPLSLQQLVEVARALARDARVLVMDEPTSALGEAEAGVLHDRVRALCQAGKAVLYISHRMEEIYALADRIAVLRDGALVACEPPSRLPRGALVRLMLGRDSEAPAAEGVREAGEVVLEVRGLSVEADRRLGRAALRSVSFTARAGEILGVAGLEGSGNAELLGAIFGSLGPGARGEVVLGSQRLSERSPAESIAAGMVLLPRDRRSSGLLLERDGVENATLASLERFSRFGWVDGARQENEAAAALEACGLRAGSPRGEVARLSGGNQQKVLLARCWLTHPRVYLLDDPTRGIDVAAKGDIYRKLRRWADEGACVLVVSAELDELLLLGDRLLVIDRGEIRAELLRGQASREDLLRAAMGGEARPPI